MTEAEDFNSHVIDEFRAHGGRVGGRFEGAPVLLLHHTGARTGRERVSPMMYQRVGDSLAVFASQGGAPTNPAWYHNLVAHPNAVVEGGTENVRVVARVARDDEREPIWETQKRDDPGFAEYESRTDRRIPVVILERAS
ncbi:MAG TPA: nitroreductase family deazaflavin-dependent oxidoreductase [Acidimicrobiales bacterium]|nr:nitroreductase family deazaflavin-dependent oxidoreductase [Acidimicrobiales bacterium]